MDDNLKQDLVDFKQRSRLQANGWPHHNFDFFKEAYYDISYTVVVV